jgi:hypothetical protein
MRSTVFLGVLATIVMAACSTARADPAAPVLLELFTSEGCSSCPAADALLAELAKDPGVVALEMHVDYWDDLGWKDPFSQALFSERQSTYAVRLGRRGVYTPQVVVNGAAEGVGSDRGRIAALRVAARPPAARLALVATRVGDALDIQAGAPEAPAGAELVVAIAESGLATQVQRGENAGRRLAHGAVVRRLVAVPASGHLRIPLEPSWHKDQLSVVAILHAGRTGPVLGLQRVVP